MKLHHLVILSALVLGCGSNPKDKEAAPSQQKKEQVPARPKPSADEQLRRRIQGPGGVERDQLLRLLSSTGPARKWAPFALGASCERDKAQDTGHRIVSAVAGWMSADKPPSPEELMTAGWALGACPSEDTEELLRSWLASHPQAKTTGLLDAGVFGLAALADRLGTLSERTQTSLLDAASREKRAELLLPLGRIGRLSDAVGAHILEVTGQLLTAENDEGKRHAIFALGSAGPSAAAPLSQVLLADTFTPQERAAAAQALGRLGRAGQEALDETLRDILSRGLPVEYDRELWIPLRALFGSLETARLSKKHLSELSTVVLSEGEEKEKLAQRRRMVWLRCQAARLLAGSKYDAPDLLKCDPDKGRVFKLAQLRTLAREPLTKKRSKEFLAAFEDDDPAVVQAALRLLAGHSEVTGSAKLLENALDSSAPGTIATAAQVIAAYPSRAHESADSDGPSEAIIARLKTLLTPQEPDTVPAETRAAAAKAAGSLRALSLRPAIEKLCNGPLQSMWHPAEQALGLLGTEKTQCPKTPPKLSVDAEEFNGQVTLVVDSDVGELLLHVDGRDAPVSTAHFLKNVDQGVYNGLAIHGVRAGFAVQFGDKDGDGYQDAPGVALPHEISPTPFDSGSFGMSAFSPGSHDTHIFVMVSDAPQLHGSRVRLGRTEGPWHLLTVGDVLHSIKRQN